MWMLRSPMVEMPSFMYGFRLRYIKEFVWQYQSIGAQLNIDV